MSSAEPADVTAVEAPLSSTGGLPVRVLAVVSVGHLLTVLAVTVVNTATATLGDTLHASLLEVQWIVTAYLLAVTATLPVSSWASHRFGARRVWVASLVAFAVGSALCGFANSPLTLIACRVLQGIGAGMVLPVGQTLVVRNSRPRHLARALSIVALVNVTGPALGPVIGGLLVGLVSWRWIFLGLVVPALAVAYASARALPHDRPEGLDLPPLDVRGLLLLAPGAAVLTAALATIAAKGTIALGDGVLLLVGTALVAAFVAHALPRGAAALVDLELMRGAAFRSGAILAGIFGALMFGALFVLPLYWELARGYPPLHAGLLLLPQGVGAVVTLMAVSHRGEQIPTGLLVCGGLLVCAAGTAPFVFFADSPTPVLEVALLARGLGLSGVLIPTLAATYRDIPASAMPSASALVNVALRFGGSAGTALLAAILQQRLGPFADWIQDGAPAGSGGVPSQVTDAFAVTFAITLAVTLVALVPARRLATRRR